MIRTIGFRTETGFDEFRNFLCSDNEARFVV